MAIELTEQILKYIDEHDKVDTLDLIPILKEDHQKIVGALKSIESTGDLVHSETVSRKSWELTDEGRLVVTSGSHEAIVFNGIPDDGILQNDLMKVSIAMDCITAPTVLCHNRFFSFLACTVVAKRKSRFQQSHGQRLVHHGQIRGQTHGSPKS